MIKLFRKTRQMLLSEGKLRKYFKYAVGEILLVVIGILIAVQINNWNIKLKNEDREILYLTRLTTNLGSDVRRYESIMSKDSLLIDTLNLVQKDLKSYIGSISNPVEEFDFLTAGYKFSSNRTVIDNLISSGQIGLLRSNYLVEDIFLYYRTADHVESTIDATILANNNQTINNLILRFNSGSISDSRYIKTLENAIQFRSSLIEKQIKWYSAQKRLAEKLIKKINEEIYFIEEVY